MLYFANWLLSCALGYLYQDRHRPNGAILSELDTMAMNRRSIAAEPDAARYVWHWKQGFNVDVQ